MQRTITSGLDPKVRQPRTALQQMQSPTPGLSELVPARLDRFGEEIEREGGLVRRMADPFTTSSAPHDPIAEELHRLGVNLPALTGRVKLPGGREVTAKESRRIMQAQGKEMREAFEAVMRARNHPRYLEKLKVLALTDGYSGRNAASLRLHLIAARSQTGAGRERAGVVSRLQLR